MRFIFRVECNVEVGHVETTLESLPFMPVKGMYIAPTPDADLLEVDGVYWLASAPDVLEVWLVEEDAQVSPWPYFKKQGYMMGHAA